MHTFLLLLIVSYATCTLAKYDAGPFEEQNPSVETSLDNLQARIDELIEDMKKDSSVYSAQDEDSSLASAELVSQEDETVADSEDKRGFMPNLHRFHHHKRTQTKSSKFNKRLPPTMPSFNKRLPPNMPSFHKRLPPNMPAFNKRLPPNMPSFNKRLPPNMPSFNKRLPPNMPSFN